MTHFVSGASLFYYCAQNVMVLRETPSNILVQIHILSARFQTTALIDKQEFPNYIKVFHSVFF